MKNKLTPQQQMIIWIQAGKRRQRELFEMHPQLVQPGKRLVTAP
jgi:hypothetical protein